MQSGCEGLESRVLLAFNPSAREQSALELINRMRQDPAAEINLLLASRDRDVKDALAAFDVNLKALRKQWASLVAAAPVAWNEDLYDAAVAHTKVMIARDGQSHQFSGEAGLRERISAQGYTDQSFLGENIFAYTESVFHAHAGFAIDWGKGKNGIQNPPGHRITIMNGNYKEVGIAILNAPKGVRSTGPLLTTQDFGGDVSDGNAYFMGTVRRERNGNIIYDAGEGLGRISITISGKKGTFTTSTLSAGAYQIKVPPGTYNVTARGLTVGGRVTQKYVKIGRENVKTDFVLAPDRQAPKGTLAAGNVGKAGAKTYTFKVAWTDNVAVGTKTIGSGDVMVVGPNQFKATARLVAKTPTKNAKTVTATYRFDTPGGKWDQKDNGSYSVRLLKGQVKDIFGRTSAATTLGAFSVATGTGAKRRAPAAMAARPVSSPFASMRVIEVAVNEVLDAEEESLFPASA